MLFGHLWQNLGIDPHNTTQTWLIDSRCLLYCLSCPVLNDADESALRGNL